MNYGSGSSSGKSRISDPDPGKYPITDPDPTSELQMIQKGIRIWQIS
jgi:hypothetical protein